MPHWLWWRLSGADGGHKAAIVGVIYFKNENFMNDKTKQKNQLMFKDKMRDLMVVVVKCFRGNKEEYSQHESTV